MRINRTIRSVILVAVMIAAGLGVGLYLGRQYLLTSVPPPDGMLWPNPKQVEPFRLADQDGKPFDLRRLEGKWSFLYFGYTHCPDVCPLTLTILNQVQTKLVKTTDATVQTIFITVDPSRDTPAVLRRYLHNYNKHFIGLDGTVADIKELSRQFGVVSSRGEKGPAGNYQVNHSASVFLIDPHRRLITIFAPPLDLGAVLARFYNIREFLQRRTST
jgi:protein SCO1/2